MDTDKVIQVLINVWMTTGFWMWNFTVRSSGQT